MTTQQIAERIAACRLMRLREVADVTSIGRATIYAMMKEGEFPRPVSVTKRRVAWKHADILDWLESREAQAA
jgi:prophage regulatory protein